VSTVLLDCLVLWALLHDVALFVAVVAEMVASSASKDWCYVVTVRLPDLGN